MFYAVSSDSARLLPSNREAIPTIGTSLTVTTRYVLGLLVGIGLTGFGFIAILNTMSVWNDSLLRAGLAFVAGIIIITFCAYKLKSCSKQCVIAHQLDHYGQNTQGIIVARWVDNSSDEDDLYYVCYRFGDGYGARQQVNAPVFESLSLGDTVTINYLPANPNLSRMK